MWVTYLHEFDRRPKQFIYFSSFYVSPVVEARDVVSPMLAGTTSLKRCPYFSQGSERRRRGGERLIWRQPVVTYSPTRIFYRKDRSRCSLCTSKCKLYFSYGSIFIMNSFSLLIANNIFIRSMYAFLRSMLRKMVSSCSDKHSIVQL